MRQFFKFMLASMAGFILTMLVMFFFLTVFIASVASMAGKKEVTISEKTLLHLKFDKPIPERSPAGPFQFSSTSFFETTNVPGLLETMDLIKQASEDKNIAGIYLELSNIPSGMATLEEIRNELLNFKKSGKFIYAYGEVYSQKAYYLATVADKIIVNPQGSIDFKGLTGKVMFLKGLLQKLDVNAQIIRHGKYKSAIEPFITDKMSDANKEQTLTYVSSIWNHVVNQISVARNLDRELMMRAADSLLLEAPEDAVRLGFVDQTAYKDQFIDLLKSTAGIDQDDKLKLVTLTKYKDVKPTVMPKRSKDKIAIIYGTGSIVNGEGNQDNLSSETISKAIRKARMDSSIKAIVFRVNSPGGDALASDVILREAKLAAETKPFVVTMGDYAASGGYYIACAADTILANPTTLTGSIGVFGIIPDMQSFFQNKLGITFDKVETNDNSDFMSITRPMTSYEEKVITNQIERIYTTFITHVSEGRSMPIANVDSIGQGRVWSGIDGLNINLVDRTGGLRDALAIAASMANLEDYRTVGYPEQKDPFTELFESLSGDSEDVKLRESLGVFYPIFKEVKSLSSAKGIQARLPFMIEVE